MANPLIKQFQLRPKEVRQFPRCYKCGQEIRFVAPKTCDNCGNKACSRHAPLLQAGPWYCDICLDRIQQFQQQYSVPATKQASQLLEKMTQVESMYNEQKIEANKESESIFEELILGEK